MPGSGAGKGNPASKRMMNPRRKERRAQSWARGERRKDARREAQAEREANNREALPNGFVFRTRAVLRADGSIRGYRHETPSEALRRIERERREIRRLSALRKLAASLRPNSLAEVVED